jgi:hypothetical protein
VGVALPTTAMKRNREKRACQIIKDKNNDDKKTDMKDMFDDNHKSKGDNRGMFIKYLY